MSDYQSAPPLPTNADLTQQLLFRLMTEVGGLGVKIADVAGQNTMILEEQHRASEGRQAIYDKLTKVDLLSQEVDRLTPLVDKHEVSHNRTGGVIGFHQMMWPVVAAILSSLAAVFGLKWSGH